MEEKLGRPREMETSSSSFLSPPLPRDILALVIEFEFRAHLLLLLHFRFDQGGFDEKSPDINPLFCRNCTR